MPSEQRAAAAEAEASAKAEAEAKAKAEADAKKVRVEGYARLIKELVPVRYPDKTAVTNALKFLKLSYSVAEHDDQPEAHQPAAGDGTPVEAGAPELP